MALFGLAPAFWGFTIAFLIATLTLPVLVYVVLPLTGGSSNLVGLGCAIIAAMANNGTMFELGDDGRYRPRPMRVNRREKTIDVYRDGDWHDVEGTMENVFRLGFRDAAFTWEKGENALEEITIDPDQLDGWGSSIESKTGIAADGSEDVLDEEDVLLLDDVRADRFYAFNPYPNGEADLEDEDEEKVVVDMDVIHQRMEGSAETGLLEKALERALVEAAYTSRLEQIALFLSIFLAMGGGAAIAWITT